MKLPPITIAEWASSAAAEHGLRVGERPVRVDADEVRAWDRQRPRTGPGREHELPVADPLPTGELDLVLVRVDRLDRRLEPELDDGLLPLGQRQHEGRVAVLLLAQEPLRERWPVVRRVGLGGEDRDVRLAAARAVLGREPPGRETASDDDDRVVLP